VSTVAIASIAAAGIGAAGSAAAAGTQASAANNAAALQQQEQQQSLAFQEQQWNTQQANEAPFLKAGQQEIGQLSNELQAGQSGPFASWTGQFSAPTAAEAAQTPGYQFQLNAGENALQNSAAANGGLLSTGTAKGIEGYAQGLASTNYQNTFQNALTQYQTAYNTFQNNQANLFNRQAAVAGIGQTTAGQLGQQGQAASSNVAGINATAGSQIGQNINNAGAATASGYAGAANALGSGIQGISGALSLQQLLNQNNTGAINNYAAANPDWALGGS
jgi:hypothetical protein